MTDVVRVAFFNPLYDEWPPGSADCSTPVEVVGPDDLDQAHGVVFHLPTLDRRRFAELRKPRGQVWVAWSLESRATHPEMNDPAILRRIDLEMTYERSSDVWDPYFGRRIAVHLLKPPPVKTARAPIVWLQSNAADRSGRKEYFAELARRVWVDSYGDVARNRPERIPRTPDDQLALYQQYKFTLAFENSFAPDYVTEKFWLPLMAGSVPVYRGTEAVTELAPAPGCYIDARDFASATELGAYLDDLDRDDAAYARFHEWRADDVSDAFKELTARLEEPLLCRLANAISVRRSRPPPASGRRHRRPGTGRR